MYAQEFTVDGKPGIYVIVAGPHNPPLPEELTLGMGLVATAAQIRNWSESLPLVISPWPY